MSQPQLGKLGPRFSWHKKNGCSIWNSRLVNLLKCEVLLDVGANHGGHLHHIDSLAFGHVAQVC